MTLAWLAAGEPFPPPGRIRLSFADAEAELVSDPYFASSTSRHRLWDGLGAYLARFVLLEQRHQSLLSEPLVPFVWLGGSFVSNKQEPRNLDVTVALSGAGRLALKGQSGAGWLTDAFSRARTTAEFDLCALELPHLLVPSVFQSHRLRADEQTYLRERGAWDDWWQRIRDAGEPNVGPSAHTAASRRGYVEVVL